MVTLKAPLPATLVARYLVKIVKDALAMLQIILPLSFVAILIGCKMARGWGGGSR